MTSQPNPERTGRYVRQPGGYRAFYPADLPFTPPIRYDDELLYILSMADQAIGRLDSSADMIPNPDIFVRMYVQKEAIQTSQLEGVTQASLSEFLEQEATREASSLPPEHAEVRNYVTATNHALSRLDALPLGLELVKETHRILLQEVRGSEFTPGEFRTRQNWIGRPGSDVHSADFVPPPPDVMEQSLDNLEQYIHEADLTPDLVKTGLMHYQFETIHPFRDGNGRMGRLMITLYLCQQGILKRPLLYLSEFLNEHKSEYYTRLQAVRDHGDIEGWLKYILTAIWRVAEAADRTARRILVLREKHRNLVEKFQPRSGNGLRLLDHLFQDPVISVNRVAAFLEVSYPTANNLLRLFVEQGILKEAHFTRSIRLFLYQSYLALMDQRLSASGNSEPDEDFTKETDI